MSPLTAESRIEWSTRLAQALIQGGYDTESNLAPLVEEARQTGQSLAFMLISRNLALPGVVVGALAHLAQLPAVDLAAMTPSPEARAAMPDAVAQQFEASPSSSTAMCWPWRSLNLRPRRTSILWRPRWASGSTRCCPIRRSSSELLESLAVLDRSPGPLHGPPWSTLANTGPPRGASACRASVAIGHPGPGG